MNLTSWIAEPIARFVDTSPLWLVLVAAVITYSVAAFLVAWACEFIWGVGTEVANVLFWPHIHLYRLAHFLNPMRVRRERLFREIFGFPVTSRRLPYDQWKACERQIWEKLHARAQDLDRVFALQQKGQDVDRSYIRYIKSRFWQAQAAAREAGFVGRVKSYKDYLG